jgi:hypothetical protein
MYVEFLNSEPFVASNTGGSSTATNGLGNRDDYFKSGMSNDFLAGIFRTDSSGGLVLGDVDELGSDFIESSTSADDTFRIKANNYSDPFKVLEKPRQATDLEVIYNIIPGRSSYPIPFVTKRAAIEFCAWLGPQYRLPTGNEWEYAARGGAPASAIIDFPFTSSDLTRVPTEVVSASSGDPIIDAYLNQMHLIANFQGEFNESPGPAPVMSYKPNGYGIYDTMGNLYEWTASSVFEGTGGITASLGTSHLRGGSWASRNFHNLSVWGKIISAGDENYFGDTGFRIVFQKATVFTAENLAQNQ